MIGDPCIYCHRSMVVTSTMCDLQRTRDHTTPKHKGGTVIAYACRRCNGAKAGDRFEDFLLFASECLRSARPRMRNAPVWVTRQLFEVFMIGLKLRHIE